MSVTITGTTFWADWPHASDATFEVRAKSDKSWVADDLSIVPAGKTRVVGTGSITALRPTLPSIVLPATSAGLDNQTAKWTVTLHRIGRKDVVHTVLADFPLPSSFEPSTTWAQISINKNGHQPLRDTSVYTKIETNTQIALAAGSLSNATELSKGRVRLSVPAIDPTDPEVVGSNDAAYPAGASPLPSLWGRRKDTGNPLFAVSSGDRQFENYTCAPIRIGSLTYIYTKGTTQLHAYSRTDAGVLTYLGVVLSPGGVGTWDAANVIEPVVFLDGTTIHLFYKGRNAGGVHAWGHATASTSAPTVFTKDAANPIKTSAQVATDMGLGTVTDTAITEVIKIGSTYNFYFYAGDGTTWKVGRATSATINTPSIVGQLAGFASGSNRITVLQSVFKPDNANFYIGTFKEGSNTIDSNPESWRALFVATSFDGVTWTRIDPNGMSIWPTGGTSGWEARMTHHAKILKDPTDTANLRPLLISNEYHVYYSGIDSTGLLSQAGLMYMTPGAGSASPLSFPATESSIPPIRFANSHGVRADATISTFDDATGTDIHIGSNMHRAPGGTFPRLDPSLAASAMRLARTSRIEFYRWDAGALAPAFTPLVIDTDVGVEVQGSGPQTGVLAPAKLHIKNTTFGSGMNMFVSDAGAWSLNENNATNASRISMSITNTADTNIDFWPGAGEFRVNGAAGVRAAFRATNTFIALAGLPVYANNAAASGAGLAPGSLYRTGGDPDLICVVH